MNVLGPGPEDEAQSWTTSREWRSAACDHGTEGIRRGPLSVRALRARAAVRSWSRLCLIRLRSVAFIGVRINAAMQVADVNGIR